MLIVPNNWAELQHYKDRSPPWIKLHKKLLDNYEFQSLPVASRALAPMLWLLASEHENGVIDASPQKLSFRLRMTESSAKDALKPLIENGFFSAVPNASKALAETEGGAIPETEAERETEKRQRPARKCPSDFTLTPEMREWATKEAPGVDVDRETAKMRDHTFSKAKTDWPATWRNWIREAFDRLQSRPGAKPVPIGRHTDSADETRRLLAEKDRGTKTMPAEIRQLAAQLTGRKAA